MLRLCGLIKLHYKNISNYMKTMCDFGKTNSNEKKNCFCLKNNIREQLGVLFQKNLCCYFFTRSHVSSVSPPGQESLRCATLCHTEYYFTHAFKVNIIKYSLLYAMYKEQIHKPSVKKSHYRGGICKFAITDRILDCLHSDYSCGTFQTREAKYIRHFNDQ